ncbi:MAG: DNA-formamidopyrimidine glycosylase [Limnochordales bacterium]|nr:DNA-formamidopyrimidine glycosylase [Bacillota bacterium]
MPELPEVETVRRQLAAALPGRTVVDVDVRLARTVQNATPEELAAFVRGRAFAGVGRRGKYLLLPLQPRREGGAGDEPEQLVVHLRMTGRLTVAGAREAADPYTRVVFVLDDGRELRFADVRTFGTIHLCGPGRPAPRGLQELGPEPLDDAFTPDVLAAALRGRRAPVKAVLLDQRCVAGVGNIYADEALFAAGIHPGRAAASLTAEETALLHAALREVLEKAIAFGGTTIRDYVNGNGAPGGFQRCLQVYGRAGEPCPHCGEPIARLRLAGRGTHFCPRCQR